MQAKLWCGVIAVALLGACGPSRSKTQTNAGVGSKYEPDSRMTDSEIENEEIDDGRKEFDKEAAEIVTKRGARKVQECSKSAGTPAGEGEVTVTFDGEKGRITEVELPSYWSDSAEKHQKCIKNAFIGEYVPPFEGGNQTMAVSITIPEPGAAPKKDE